MQFRFVTVIPKYLNFVMFWKIYSDFVPHSGLLLLENNV